MKRNEMKNMPIGVFDSGVGGISVLRELVFSMPEEKFIYYGDSANAPYGVKSREEILSLSENAATMLIERNVKALVIACNTATSVAGAYLRNKYPDLPIIGIEPALKPAAENSKGKTVAVMATEATLLGEKYHELSKRFSSECDIITVPAPKIVEFVENGVFSGEELEDYIKGIFAPYSDRTISGVVLGCTHFPFVKETVKKVLGEDAVIYDGGKGTAAETKRRLIAEGLLSDDCDGFVEIENSLGTDEILDLSWDLFES